MRDLIAAAALCLATTPAFALNVCVEGAYPPFSETAADGSIVGFDIDIANAICMEIDGAPCTLVKVDWDGIIPALLEKKCDAIVASMSSTAERKQVIDFSAKYYQVPNEFVGRADSGIEISEAGLAGKVVGAQRGTIHQAYMEKHFPGVQLTLYGSQDEAILDLTSGRIDLIVGDAIQLEEGFVNTPQGEGYARVGEQFYDPEIHGEGAAIGVRKESTELRDKISAAIAKLRESGKYDELQKKYFDLDIYGS